MLLRRGDDIKLILRSLVFLHFRVDMIEKNAKKWNMLLKGDYNITSCKTFVNGTNFEKLSTILLSL